MTLAGLVVLAILAASCTSDGAPDEGAPPTRPGPTGDEGRIPTEAWMARQDDYLTWSTTGENTLDPSDIDSVLVHAERAERDPSFVWNPGALDPAALEPTFEKLRAYDDTGDFDINEFLFLLADHGDTLPGDYRAALEERVLAFKYWWTEPTPEGTVDSQYYFTENHQIIFLADEYIAGQLYPEEVFISSGMTGAQHVAHAEPRIRSWIDQRARFGFSEWLSDVYAMEDIKGLLLLAEHADDPEIAALGAMATDLVLVEMASHTHAGAFGATHGRSYMKDKMTALDEDNFSLSKMVFDDTDHPYQEVDNTSLLATADRYRPAEVVRRIAASEGEDEVRQRQSLPVPYLLPVDPEHPPPFGLTYEGEDGIMTWWAMGAQYAWPVIPASVDLIEERNLWSSDLFQSVSDLRPIVNTATDEEMQALAAQLGRQFNGQLLSEVNTYTWRQPEVMLSTAQCWRAGDRSDQAHIWQATLDPEAQVFTSHPREPVPDTTDWHTNSGYWTGEATLPCSAQYRNVGISVYAPAYGSTGDRSNTTYEPYTHAYFPTEHFDEVVERDGWVVGRLGDGYVALWSQRPTEWRTYDPATEPTNGLTEPFDLLAPGGADNVWIVETGRAADWVGLAAGGDPFAAFVDAIVAAEIQVVPLFDCPKGSADECLSAEPIAEHEVRYASPTLGQVTLQATNTTVDTPATLTVDGTPIGLAAYPRHATPWSQADMGGRLYEIEADGWTLTLDFETATRTSSAP